MELNARRPATALRVGCAALGLVVLAGCATSENAGTAPTSSEGTVYAAYRDRAVDSDAAQAQIDVLDEAVRTGELTFAAVNELTQRTFDCFTEHGIGYEEREPLELGIDVYAPDYSFAAEVQGLTEEQVTELADACIETYSHFAAMALQDPQLTGGARDERMRRALPEIVACLETNGVPVAPDATLDEVRRSVEQLARDSVEASNDTSIIECYDDW